MARQMTAMTLGTEVAVTISGMRVSGFLSWPFSVAVRRSIGVVAAPPFAFSTALAGDVMYKADIKVIVVAKAIVMVCCMCAGCLMVLVSHGTP